MNANIVLFVVFPYVAFVLAITVGIYRTVVRPSSLSSLTTQLFESNKLFWGSTAFHWGLILVLAGHLLAVLLPGSLQAWNGDPVRLLIVEATGFALGLWALAGLAILAWRRLSSSRVRAVTSKMDAAVLALLVFSLATGVAIAVFYRYGSSWFAVVLAPYLRSLVALDPRPELTAELPLLVKLHALNFFVLMALVPFSRLIHIVTVPLGYLYRPYQLVIWNQGRGESNDAT